MGNAALRDLSEITETSLDEIAGATVVVDAHNWLYKYMLPVAQYTDSSAYTTDGGVELPVLIGATQGMKKFFEHNITPIFVFDGTYHKEKQQEVQERKQQKQDAERQATQAREKGDNLLAARMDARSKRLTDAMIDSTKQLLTLFDVHYTVAPTAGEAQAAYMARTEQGIHYVISDDYDSLLFKAPCTLRNFTSSTRQLEGLRFKETLTELNLSHKQLIDCAILCGTDYNEGVHGYGPKTSVKEIKKYGDIETLLKETENDSIENLSTLRNIFLNPPTHSDYTLPTESPDPDINNIRQFLTEEDIEMDTVEKSLERIEELVSQPGLDDWT